jgi:hypothetical protein
MGGRIVMDGHSGPLNLGPYHHEDERTINTAVHPGCRRALDKAAEQAKLEKEHVSALVLNLPTRPG